MEHEIFLVMWKWGKTKSCKAEMKTPSFGSVYPSPPPPPQKLPSLLETLVRKKVSCRARNILQQPKEYTLIESVIIVLKLVIIYSPNSEYYKTASLKVLEKIQADMSSLE